MKNLFKKSSLAVAPCLLILACSPETKNDDYDDPFVNFIEKERIGTSTDVWLERKSELSGKWDKIALYFGMVGDRGVCEAVVKSLQNTPNGAAKLRCVEANQNPQTSGERGLENFMSSHQGDRVL